MPGEDEHGGELDESSLVHAVELAVAARSEMASGVPLGVPRKRELRRMVRAGDEAAEVLRGRDGRSRPGLSNGRGNVMTAKAWPEDWEDRVSGDSCPICQSLGGRDNEHWVHVTTGSCTEVYLDRASRVKGYCMVMWRLGHAVEPSELDDAGAAAYWREVMAAGRAVLHTFEPLKVNYLTLGNGVPHLHTHVVPRYVEDPAPGGPLPWEQLVGHPLFDEVSLHGQAASLREAWS
jgi:diadenosine tetraphosphate (Ap4A) HIT family hydrolase